MEGMISDMQKEQAFEQELQEKGLRNIIEGLPRGGRRSGGSSRPVTAVSAPKEKPKPKSRKTRKTKSQTEELVEETKVTERRVDAEVNDDGDFSDFSL